MSKVNPIELQKHLKEVDYPAKKQDLIERAQQQGADENALSALKQIPDEEYGSPTDVTKAISNVE